MHIGVKKLVLVAILTAIALIIYIVEALIPLPIPIPGVKLGLANAVTLFVLFLPENSFLTRKSHRLTIVDAFLILLCRILLGAFFTGKMVAFVYSLIGGLLGFAAQILVKRLVTEKQIWVCGAIGGIFHNVGQILAAIVITGMPSIALYLPILVIAGVFAGALTGLIAQITISRIM